MLAILRPPGQICKHLSRAPAFRMVETITSTTAAGTASTPAVTKLHSVSSVSMQEGNWTVTPVTTFPDKWEYTDKHFRRGDESSDTEFYKSARFVTHIDDHAIEKLTSYYGSLLPSSTSSTASSSTDFKILDLCGSWISHIPLPLPPRVGVFGLGLNEEELLSNEAYNLGWKVFDLNASEEQDWSASMPMKLGEVDVVICSVSIDYLVYPLSVLKECHKLLKQDGTIHLAISNRCFATKAITLWLRLSESARLELIANYLHFSGFEDVEVVEVAKGGDIGQWEGDWGSSDPLWVVRGRKSGAERIVVTGARREEGDPACENSREKVMVYHGIEGVVNW